jgi:cation transport ATPase
MGTGADVAIESAGLTLVKGDLRTIARAMRLSDATVWNIRQNIFLAFIYNTVAIPVAAAGLADANDRVGGNGALVDLGDSQCAATQMAQRFVKTQSNQFCSRMIWKSFGSIVALTVANWKALV